MTETENDPAAEVVPMFSNATRLLVSDGTTRITFGENYNGTVRYHAAIMLPSWAALAMANLILSEEGKKDLTTQPE